MTWTALTVPLTGDRAGGSMPVPSTTPMESTLTLRSLVINTLHGKAGKTRIYL